MKGLFLLIAISLANICFSCTCTQKNTIEKEFKNSDFVLLARVISSDTILIADSNQIKTPLDNRLVNETPRTIIEMAHYKIQVSKIYKGTTSSEVLDIYTSTSDESCGLQFTTGMEYIIYGSKTVNMYFDDSGDYYPPAGENIVWVNKCSRTKIKTEKEISALEKI